MIYGSRWWRGVGFKQGSDGLKRVDQCGMPVGVARMAGCEDDRGALPWAEGRELHAISEYLRYSLTKVQYPTQQVVKQQGS